MNDKQVRSKKLDLQLKRGADVQSRRRMEWSESGAFQIEDVLDIKGAGAMTFVMCDRWLFELFELEAGEYYFMRGTECVHPQTRRFGTFYPPFSILRVCFRDVRGRWTGMASSARLPERFMAAPTLFETASTEAPQSIEQVEEILDASYNRRSIDLNPKPSLLSLKAKRLLDENYLIHPSIARIAARLKVTHAHLTRQFKRDFGLSPSAYCHQVRIAEAMFRLAKGEEIIDISQDVGYNDLSRFYKQFRKAKTQTPGYCQARKQQ
jgi:AraC-like DNA-binding protein